jgi:hypothetical protein
MENAVTGELCSWTIFESPIDAPGWFVTRMFRGASPTETVMRFETLEETRAVLLLLFPDMICFPRNPQDDSSVVETWL